MSDASALDLDALDAAGAAIRALHLESTEWAPEYIAETAIDAYLAFIDGALVAVEADA